MAVQYLNLIRFPLPGLLVFLSGASSWQAAFAAISGADDFGAVLACGDLKNPLSEKWKDNQQQGCAYQRSAGAATIRQGFWRCLAHCFMVSKDWPALPDQSGKPRAVPVQGSCDGAIAQM